MAKGKKTGGRKAGTPNKFSISVKASTLNVYNALGGDDAMTTWARNNQTEFYKIAARLIPTEVVGHGGGPVQVAMKVIDELHPDH